MLFPGAMLWLLTPVSSVFPAASCALMVMVLVPGMSPSRLSVSPGFAVNVFCVFDGEISSV